MASLGKCNTRRLLGRQQNILLSATFPCASDIIFDAALLTLCHRSLSRKYNQKV